MVGAFMGGLSWWETRAQSHPGPCERLYITQLNLVPLRREEAGVFMQQLFLLIILGAAPGGAALPQHFQPTWCTNILTFQESPWVEKDPSA